MKKIKIAQVGAFDVASYGDCLFPLVFEKAVRNNIAIESITLFSPSARENGYNQLSTYSLDEFEEIHKKEQFDCIVVGGGELFHFQPITFKNSKGEQIYKEGLLWEVPLQWSRKYKIPIAFNGVGVPYGFSQEQGERIQALLDQVVYFSVRDRYSYERLKGIVPEPLLYLVPDSVWLLDTVYDSAMLEKERTQLFSRYHVDKNRPYIVLQYGTTYQLDEIADQLKKIQEEHDVQIVIIPINYSHEDIDDILRLEQEKELAVNCIDQLLQPKEIAALIAGASVFIGTSLHGNLTAMRYGIKSIGIDMYPSFVSKMDGLFEMAGKPQYLIADGRQLSACFTDILKDAVYGETLHRQLQVIDEKVKEHFQIMCQKLVEKEEVKVTVDAQQMTLTEFKKAYITCYDKQDKKITFSSIGKKNEKGYTFFIPKKEIKENKFTFAITNEMPVHVEITAVRVDKMTGLAQYKRKYSEIGGWCYDRNAVFECSLERNGEIEIDCKIVLCEEEEKKELFSFINNKEMHIDQLIRAERKYIRQIEQEKATADEKIKAVEKSKAEKIAQIQAEKEQAIAQRDIKINNQRGHIEQLLQVDRDYQRIIHSKGWRLVSFPGRMFEKLYPVGTPRRERVSLIAKYIRALNWTNIKFVCSAFSKGGMKQVKKEMHAFAHRTSEEMPQEEPELFTVDEITSIEECTKLHFKKYDKPTVSIVIPVYNQFTYTYYCLKSILDNSGDVTYEIIIADDVSNDLTTRITEIADNIIVARNKENQRFLRNCNQAAKVAKGKYILFLNNDTQVQENWLQPLVDLIEKDDTIGMVGAKLIYPDGTLQEAGGIIWGDGHAWNYGNGQNPALPEFNYVKEVDYISGAAIMIRHDLWKEIGGFDEYFAPAYCEDSDLAFEVRKHGYKLMYQPLSVVVHFEGKSNGTDTSAGVKKYQVENSQKLAKKWEKEFKTEQSQTEQDLFHAMDRSQGKKTILVIDHYVPTFDKDAGSKTTFQYLQMFVKQGYKVIFLGDNFYQSEPYTTILQQMGIFVLYGPWYAQNYRQWILDHQEFIDFAYLNRPHITEKYIDFLREETDIKCIYYGHDLHFLRLKREYELSGDEKFLKESQDWKEKEFAIMHKAAINYYPSYVEVDEIHKIDPTIPAKAITAYVYEEFRTDIDFDFSRKEGILFVGGFGHPPNADAVLWFVDQVYPQIRKQQDIPFYIVGSKAPEKIKKLDGKEGIIVKGFVSEEELQELYNTCKIVVVPLRYGAGVKGKVVEALYYGTPMVTTTVGIEGIQGAEKFMEVTDDAGEFAQKVVSLYNDNEKLKKTVENYQNYVKENNSVEAVWNIVKDDFQ